MTQELLNLGIKGTEDWYFGNIMREQANEILLNGDVGMYLVRGSRTEPGSFALSVRDKQKANHYKIFAIPCKTQAGFKFKIGSLEFISIHHILEYYKKSKLADSNLTVPAPRPLYRAKIDYRPDSDAATVGLRRNECVLFLDLTMKSDSREDTEWWHVVKRNSGEVSFVPKSCLRQCNPGEADDSKFGVLRQLNLPFDVEAMRARNPNIFDSSQLRLEVGDQIRVKQVIQDTPELWFGVNLRSKAEGVFPFNYVRPLSQELSAGTENCRHSAISSNSAASSGRLGNRTSNRASGCTLDEHPEDAH